MISKESKKIIEYLSCDDLEVVRGALEATVKGDFFPDWEFQTLFGVNRDEVREVLSSWPSQSVDDVTFICAFRNSLSHLSGYPHGQEQEILRYVPGGVAEIRRVRDKLRSLDAQLSRDGRPMLRR